MTGMLSLTTQARVCSTRPSVGEAHTQICVFLFKYRFDLHWRQKTEVHLAAEGIAIETEILH